MLRTSHRKLKSIPLVWRQMLYSRAFTVFVLLSIAVVVVATTKKVIRQVEINQQVTALEKQIASLQQQNGELDTVLEYFNSSTYQDKLMKERLNMQTPGEHVIIIPNQATSDPGKIQVVPTRLETLVPNNIKWRKYFFNY